MKSAAEYAQIRRERKERIERREAREGKRPSAGKSAKGRPNAKPTGKPSPGKPSPGKGKPIGKPLATHGSHPATAHPRKRT